VEKVSIKKQLTIVRLYLSGLSYSQIVAKTGVSKGTVANVIATLKGGQFAEAQLPAEQIELLHELAADLHQLNLNPSQAVTGLAVLSRLHELGIEPSDFQEWATMCKHLAADKADAPSFVKAALYLEELRKATGLTVPELEQKASSLQHEVDKLQPIVKELKKCPGQLEEFKKAKNALAEDISHLEKRFQPLSNDIALKEKREAELSYRVQELEQRAQTADERLAAARQALKILAKLGLSAEEFPGFVHRIGIVAQRHGIKPAALRDRLLQELEQLHKGLSLESLVKARRTERDSIQKAISKASEKRSALESAISELNQQKASLEAAIAEEQAHMTTGMQTLNADFQEVAAKLKQDLQKDTSEALAEVQNLRNQTLDLGQELGHFSGIVEADGWLKTLASLIKGDASASAAEVRIAALAVLHGLKSYAQHKQGTSSYLLSTYLDNVIQEVHRWVL